MQYKIELACPSSQHWLDTVMNDFNSFLQDHADCERKASAMAMSFVAKYPERHEIIPELIATGIEELEHFQQVYEFMSQKGVSLAKEMAPDPYIKQLMALGQGGTPLTRFRDRLLLASIIESRGCERFKLVSEVQQDEDIRRFYKLLWASEAKHSHIFVHMALRYFDKQEVDKRIEELVNAEADIIRHLPLRAALH
ncbi:tRNA-(ms[2]io[6]A)-hydroxylase [Catalinimonas niigatensis]|uniref:tRNA-(ms[2]io[6]A)-hydroxylase n=1 Tax=Catalinimonas niigatensis TaxID=1397264 RepID=UPI0026651B1E|nr:tRNA-(ms[2]io[6]A)-hydroxylase [Catalinimonas niigatensis]WPP53240.1 tRNA-(ms[2]io[6]A)-hydroxylase [Catalinimonas niigatensis]